MLPTNPFNPTFGDVPEVYLDNEKRASQLANTIQKSKFSRSFFITGVRGSGKTSFMTKVESILSQDKNCLHINLINSDSIVTDLVTELYNASQNKAQKMIEKINSIGFKNVKIEIQKSVKSAEQIATNAMNKIAQEQKYVLITLDEITINPEIVKVAQIFNELKRHQLPIYILMTGLPDLVMNIQNNQKLTFLLRSEKVYMEPLHNDEIALSYAKIFHCSLGLAQKMATKVKGYSYAFQLLGYEAYHQWEQEQNSQHEYSQITLEEAMPAYQLRLFDNAYNKIFSELSELDKQYIIFAGQKLSRAEVAQKMHKNPNDVSQYRRRAISRNIVKPAGRGYIEYTLPMFSDFIKETQDPDSIYYYPIN